MSNPQFADLSEWKQKIIAEGCTDFAIIGPNQKVSFCKTLKEARKELAKAKPYDHKKIFVAIDVTTNLSKDDYWILVDMKDNTTCVRADVFHDIEMFLGRIENGRAYVRLSQ